MISPVERTTERAVEHMDLNDHPGRVFVVGDLHGMAHALEQLLAIAGFDPGRDLVWSLGDLVDRGPFSPRCLDLLDEPWFRAIRGNHEQLLLDAVDDYESWMNWTLNGGDWALGYPWDREDLRRRLDALPYAADLKTRAGHIGLVHADLDPSCDWPEFLDALTQDAGLARQIALWSRTSANQAARGLPGRWVNGADLVLVGHSIVETAFQWGNLWFLDTGAVATDDPTSALSMLEIHPELKLWSLPTVGDPITSLWWSRHMERVTAAMARAR
jgi:serine/threonine protein phosphatase 1